MGVSTQSGPVSGWDIPAAGEPASGGNGHERPPWLEPALDPLWPRLSPAIHPFIFATGIENSAPVIAGRDGRAVRVDEMARAQHYERWQEDFALVRELGLDYLRYGPPYYRTHLGPDRYDWSFADQTFAELRRLGITPIADLCHFGVPDWIGDFQNPDWPAHFAAYAKAFATRYPLDMPVHPGE